MLPNSTLAQKNDTAKITSWRRTASRFCSACTRPARIYDEAALHWQVCKTPMFKPREYQHPVTCYTNSGNVWMTAKIFQEWFESTFDPAVRRHLRQQARKRCFYVTNVAHTRPLTRIEKSRSCTGRQTQPLSSSPSIRGSSRRSSVTTGQSSCMIYGEGEICNI